MTTSSRSRLWSLLTSSEAHKYQSRGDWFTSWQAGYLQRVPIAGYPLTAHGGQTAGFEACSPTFFYSSSPCTDSDNPGGFRTTTNVKTHLQIYLNGLGGSARKSQRTRWSSSCASPDHIPSLVTKKAAATRCLSPLFCVHCLLE